MPASEAIKVYFFDNDDNKINGFWNNQGRIVRGNQRRGRSFRDKKTL
jgi:hypothetical protein